MWNLSATTQARVQGGPKALEIEKQKKKKKKKRFQILGPPLRIPGHAPATHNIITSIFKTKFIESLLQIRCIRFIHCSSNCYNNVV